MIRQRAGLVVLLTSLFLMTVLGLSGETGLIFWLAVAVACTGVVAFVSE